MVSRNFTHQAVRPKERATKYRPSINKPTRNPRWNVTGDSRSQTACPTHMPPHANANAASVAQTMEMLSPPAAATLTPSAIVETVKDSPRA
jgi:hypothetical protein